ncbi:Monocopper oxidase-like protein SKS1 [Hibiscus syriacus]|uniref:Monocopper oxidase-like protein SKS1 n=1 Tax=Hibiscus syriacus TaxID=106335 RepID=A0A6A2XYR1_HIBSY|nr:Monocopper oxidase-like protein SKS1 [Hibiscus syriacus]
MALNKFSSLFLIHIALLLSSCFAEDPFVFYDFEVSYITASPLGVPQQVCSFFMWLSSSFLLAQFSEVWSGIQQRRSSWQDGLPGINCPIPPKWNWTYQFQVKDQIGSFFYFPSLHFQRAAGGFGGFIINNRDIIPIPFNAPDGDMTILIGDWYTRNHTKLRKALDAGKDLGMPDGVLINGKGPYRYNDTLVPDGIDYETINVHPGKTYRLRVHNVGISTSLNFRIQSHNLLIVETEGSYTVQQNYTSLDIHVGQSYSFLLTTDQNASRDYYIVASARFMNESQWKRVTGVAILRYSNSKGKVASPLPDPPQDEFDKTFSMSQARSIRFRNTLAGYVFLLSELKFCRNKPPVTIGGKRLTTLSGVSFVNPATPIRLADQFKLKGVYKLDFPNRSLTGPPKMETSVYPGAWTAILISLDNVGVWNLRTENLDSWYLGQETYMRVVNLEKTNKTEFPIPDNALYCGILSKMQKPQDISFATSITGSRSKLLVTVLMLASVLLHFR